MESAELGFSSVYLKEVQTFDKIQGRPSFNPAPGFLWPIPKSKLYLKWIKTLQICRSEITYKFKSRLCGKNLN
jgi:hypothetical protein